MSASIRWRPQTVSPKLGTAQVGALLFTHRYGSRRSSFPDLDVWCGGSSQCLSLILSSLLTITGTATKFDHRFLACLFAQPKGSSTRLVTQNDQCISQINEPRPQ
ncbi:hypothetical protein PV04_04098 [Phialophora macrospora]|uniref:Uncharacterized protein n=1 Tax=Phialophora macrospora TaxID=1851006 RepID=A0A0D2CSH6_9EURO|nr:hypothetical protein PV04_04098 [Phialophora macrospora]